MESERMVDGDVYSEETVIASEGMLLPDGVNIGDTFAVKRLPEYRIYCENAEDIHIVESARVIHKRVIAWEVKFTLDTSWGEVDSVLNPYITVYIDPVDGKIVDMYSTDG